MGNYCPYCGKPTTGGFFCSYCGRKYDGTDKLSVNHPHAQMQNIPGAQPTAAPPYPMKRGRKTRVNRKSKSTSLVRRIITLVIVLAIFGTGVWFVGDVTGLWHNITASMAENDWKKQPDYREQEQEITLCLVALADALDSRDIDKALLYIHPDAAEQCRMLFEENENRLPNLVFALKNGEITFLSTEMTGYDSERMATVEGPLPDMSGTGVIVTLVKIDNEWVVVSL